MTVLSNTALLYAKLEEALRQTLETHSNLTLRELYAKPDIHRVATKIQQVRDCILSMKKKGCVKTERIVDKASAKKRGSSFAYTWMDGAHFVIGSPTPMKQRAAIKKPSPVVTTKFAKPNLNEVELVLNGVEIIAGVNPATGRIRIIIESK